MSHDRNQTVQELAERLEVAEAAVQHWVKSRELGAIRIGKGWRIASADLAQFARARDSAQ